MVPNDSLRLAWTAVLLSLASLLPHAPAHAADAVLTVDGERGQGSLLRRGNECLIVTPRHVVEGDGFVSPTILVTYADRTRTEATLFHAFAEDVALLRLEEQPGAGCRAERFEGADLDWRLQRSGEGLLKRRQEDGSDVFTPVAIASFDAFDSIRVEPGSPSASFDQGDSGSVLYVEDRAVGMLTQVNDGTGIVMRADKLMATIGPFLAASRRDERLHLSLDADSAFLEVALSREARRQGLELTGDADAASLQLLVTSDARRLDSDTGKIVRYFTRIEVTDALDRLVAEEELEASGNSFVSLDAAAENARADLAEQLEGVGLIERLR